MTGALPPLVPLSLPEPRRRDVRRRALATARTAVRHLRGAAARRLLGRPQNERDIARALRRTFEALGATYVKLGQLVASAPGVFGDAVADEFRSCLDTGPRVPFPAVRAAVEATLGRPLGEIARSHGARGAVHRQNGRVWLDTNRISLPKVLT